MECCGSQRSCLLDVTLKGVPVSDERKWSYLKKGREFSFVQAHNPSSTDPCWDGACNLEIHCLITFPIHSFIQIPYPASLPFRALGCLHNWILFHYSNKDGTGLQLFMNFLDWCSFPYLDSFWKRWSVQNRGLLLRQSEGFFWTSIKAHHWGRVQKALVYMQVITKNCLIAIIC